MKIRALIAAAAITIFTTTGAVGAVDPSIGARTWGTGMRSFDTRSPAEKRVALRLAAPLHIKDLFAPAERQQSSYSLIAIALCIGLIAAFAVMLPFGREMLMRRSLRAELEARGLA
ncbi:MAG: hypothetical protein JO019_02305 [Candidatus Kaiserbacteria bacterium]|nr:hypothetical protein [Candidatus Kaiserbacteria bacterium]